MIRYRIVWRPEAQSDIRALYDWIADNSDRSIAIDYVSRIEAYVEELAHFPFRGTPRDDLVPGMRTRSYRRRTVVGYLVIEDRVEILEVVHGGQSWTGLTDS